MPELPEVETYVQELEPLLDGRRVIGAQVAWPRIIAEPTPEEFVHRIVGQRFVRFARRGKYMLLGLDGGDTLIVHLRMTGHLLVHPPTVAPDKHTHVVLELDDGRRLHYQDSRKFGRLWLVADPEAVVYRLGPEPLAEHFSVEGMAARLTGRKAPIKALLLDQSIVAGVGNIYADEALFSARIHPARPGGALTHEEIERLHGAIRQILATAIEHRGSSLGDSTIQNYLRPSGEQGGYQAARLVYAREGEPCSCCGAPIERRVLAQRSAHFCPNCQQ
jgi:formamidopyrimidine-DNA glycosylase